MTQGGRGGSPFFPIGLSPTALTPVSLALFTHVAARMVAKPPLAARCIGVLQTMSLPPSSAPTATGWNDSCRAGFAPAEEWRLSTAHVRFRDYESKSPALHRRGGFP